MDKKDKMILGGSVLALTGVGTLLTLNMIESGPSKETNAVNIANFHSKDDLKKNGFGKKDNDLLNKLKQNKELKQQIEVAKEKYANEQELNSLNNKEKYTGLNKQEEKRKDVLLSKLETNKNNGEIAKLDLTDVIQKDKQNTDNKNLTLEQVNQVLATTNTPTTIQTPTPITPVITQTQPNTPTQVITPVIAPILTQQAPTIIENKVPTQLAQATPQIDPDVLASQKQQAYLDQQAAQQKAQEQLLKDQAQKREELKAQLEAQAKAEAEAKAKAEQDKLNQEAQKRAELKAQLEAQAKAEQDKLNQEAQKRAELKAQLEAEAQARQELLDTRNNLNNVIDQALNQNVLTQAQAQESKDKANSYDLNKLKEAINVVNDLIQKQMDKQAQVFSGLAQNQAKQEAELKAQAQAQQAQEQAKQLAQQQAQDQAAQKLALDNFANGLAQRDKVLARTNALVSKGVFSQAQADKILKDINGYNIDKLNEANAMLDVIEANPSVVPTSI